MSGLTGYSFTATPGEDAAICMLLKGAGFSPDSQGLKKFLLNAAQVGEPEEKIEEECEEESGLSATLRVIIEAAERNPQVTDLAIKKGADLVGSLFKKLR